MDVLSGSLTSVEFLKIAVPAGLAIFAYWWNEHSKLKWEKWRLKKKACLKALNIANAVLSNYKYPNVEEGRIVPQYATVEEVRACMNELACICDGPGVLEELKEIMFGEKVTPAKIVDLRKAVREELGFRNVIDTDREKAFIGKLNCLLPEIKR